MPLHPDVKAVVDARGPIRISSLPVNEARANVSDRELEGVPVRLHGPENAAPGTISWH